MQQNFKKPMTMPVSCFNRPHYKDSVTIKEKMTEVMASSDGRVIMGQEMRTIPAPMTKSCRVDIRFTNPGCSGCKWQTGIDSRDEVPIKEKIRGEIVAAGLIPCEI